MQEDNLTVLVATADADWQRQCEIVLVKRGCLVHTACDGFEALGMLCRHVYDCVVVDDSLSDVGPIELSLNVRDLAPNEPLMLVGGDDLTRFGRVWRLCNVYYAGPKAQVLEAIPAALEVSAQCAKQTEEEG